MGQGLGLGSEVRCGEGHTEGKNKTREWTDSEDEGGENTGAPLRFLTPEQRVSSGPIFLTDKGGFSAVWGEEPGWSSGENETWKRANGEERHLFQGCACVRVCGS